MASDACVCSGVVVLFSSMLLPILVGFFASGFCFVVLLPMFVGDFVSVFLFCNVASDVCEGFCA